MGHGMQIFGDNNNFYFSGGYGNGGAIFNTDILGEAMVFREAMGKPIVRGMENGVPLDQIFQEVNQNMEQLGIQWKTADSARATTVTVTVAEANAGAATANDRDVDNDDDVTVEVESGDEPENSNSFSKRVAYQNGRAVGLKHPGDGKVYGIFNYPDFLAYLEESYDRQDNSWGTAGLTEDDLVSAAESFYGGQKIYQHFRPADVQDRARRFLTDNRQNTDNVEFQNTATNVAAGAAGGAAIGAAAGVWFFGVGAVPAALIGAGIGAVGGLLFGPGKDKGLSRDDLQGARVAERDDTTTINNPKFLQFLADQYEADNSAVYADGLNDSINETDMANAIKLWNQNFGTRHGYINADENSFDPLFENLANQYDNWGVDDNVQIEDIEARLRGVSTAERQYTDGPRY